MDTQPSHHHQHWIYHMKHCPHDQDLPYHDINRKLGKHLSNRCQTFARTQCPLLLQECHCILYAGQRRRLQKGKHSHILEAKSPDLEHQGVQGYTEYLWSGVLVEGCIVLCCVHSEAHPRPSAPRPPLSLLRAGLAHPELL